MKRYIALALALVLSLSVAGCAPQTATPPSETPSAEMNDVPSPLPEYDWGITLSLDHLTRTGATIICTQSGGNPTGELDTGSYFIVERLTENGWEEMARQKLDGELAWTSIAYLVNRDGITEWSVDWEWLYGELPDGHYRIGKEFMDFRGTANYDTMMIYAEFSFGEMLIAE